MLEQDDGPAVGGMGGEILLQPGNAARRTLVPVAGEAVRLHQVQAAPIPGIVVRGEVIVAGRHERLEDHARAVVELDIVAQFAPVPVDLLRRAVLVEVVVAEADIDGKMDPVGARPLLVAMAELQELRAFAGKHDLAAAVVGHVAADHHAQRLADPGAGGGEARRRAVDLARPAHFGQPVDRRDVAAQICVGLAFRRAMRTEAAAHPTGVDIAGENEGGVDRGQTGRTAVAGPSTA